MFELVISDKACEEISFLQLAKQLKREVQLLKGVFVYDQFAGRERICFAVPKKMADYALARAKDEIAEHLAVEYKYRFFDQRLELFGLDELMRTAFLSALAVFDKETDKKYILEHLNFFDEVNIDSCFAFCMPLLQERWTEIVSLVESNMFELMANEGLLEMMKFLIRSCPVESEEVFVGQTENLFLIENARREVQFEFEKNVSGRKKLVHQLVNLVPKKLVVCTGLDIGLKKIFEERVFEIVR